MKILQDILTNISCNKELVNKNLIKKLNVKI